MEHVDFQITDVICTLERQHAEGWHIETMYYEKEYVLVIVLDGEAEYTIYGEKYPVKKDDLILFSPNLLRSGITSPDHPWSFISVVFRMDLNEEARTYFNKSILIWNNVSDSIRKILTEVRRTWIGKTSLFQVKCKLLVTEIIYDLFISAMPYQNVLHIRKLEKARTMIQENFRYDLSVEKLAESIDMSCSNFRRLFHEAYGYSPMQYIMHLRIENARDLLLSGEVNVTEAAHLSGFDDIYYFSRVFKNKTGFSPSKLIKKQ